MGRQGPTSVGLTSPFMELKGYSGFVGLFVKQESAPTVRLDGHQDDGQGENEQEPGEGRFLPVRNGFKKGDFVKNIGDATDSNE